MKKKLFLIVLITFLISCQKTEHSQLSTHNVRTLEHSGQVTDNMGDPLVGCKVTSLELDKIVYTDFDGYYHIDVIPGTLLIFEYVSYKKETLLSKKELVVKLEDVKIDLLKTLVKN